jgi:hypothetical protein
MKKRSMPFLILTAEIRYTSILPTFSNTAQETRTAIYETDIIILNKDYIYKNFQVH